jgi:hypothetical protein
MIICLQSHQAKRLGLGKNLFVFELEDFLYFLYENVPYYQQYLYNYFLIFEILISDFSLHLPQIEQMLDFV